MQPSICLWKDLSLQDVSIITDYQSPHEIKNFLKKKFKLEDEDEGKNKIMLDLYYYTIVFAKDKKFSREQMSAFFSIVKKTHEKAIECPYGNTEETFSFFKDILACHTVKRPPFCVQLFSPNETQEITEYLMETYFRHFKLYKYVFTPKVMMDLQIKYTDVSRNVVKDKDNEEGRTDEESEGNEAMDNENKESEDSPAVKELKQMISTAVDEQFSKLKVSVEEKLKVNEETIMNRLSESQSCSNTSPKHSSKKGKKK